MRRAVSLALVGGSLLALGCQDSYGDPGGPAEPIVVPGATFNSGALPNDGNPKMPLTTSNTSLAEAGGPERGLSGRASLQAWGVAVSLKGAGTGYWTLPVGLPDLIDPGIDWAFKFRFTREAPLGDLTLLVAETDKHGKFSIPSEIPFKVKSLQPAGKKVISLVWHNHADLDLQVQSPDGKLTSSKTPNTSVVPGDHKIPKEGLPGSGTLNRDSNARCAFDGIMQEDVVFKDEPSSPACAGLPTCDYLVWVDLYDSCGEPATTFDLQLWEDGVMTFNQPGQLLDINADNGTGAGLFLHTFEFPSQGN
ncbi:MAG TPA: hypothetical protein VHB79_22970 [Polyangiaceae bacterium]|nr:hypothetical protein [Polyangiaceae bacterium]